LFVRWRMQISRPTRRVIGGSPAPSWRDFNSRMRASEIANCRCWPSIFPALRPTDNSILKTPNGSAWRPPVLLIHSRFIVFVTPASRAHTPSVEHKSSVRGLLRPAASTDSDARRGHWGGRRGLKRVLAVSTRDLNRILFSAGAPLRSPQRGSGPRNSEALVVRIEPARHPQPRGTHSTGMRSVQRANDRVRSGTCPWT
jgi:hypothetical protein